MVFERILAYYDTQQYMSTKGERQEREVQASLVTWEGLLRTGMLVNTQQDSRNLAPQKMQSAPKKKGKENVRQKVIPKSANKQKKGYKNVTTHDESRLRLGFVGFRDV